MRGGVFWNLDGDIAPSVRIPQAVDILNLPGLSESRVGLTSLGVGNTNNQVRRQPADAVSFEIRDGNRCGVPQGWFSGVIFAAQFIAGVKKPPL